MKVTMSLSLRVLSVFITVSFLSTIGASQVKIHEKIEIAPKIKISEQVNSSSTTNTTIPLLFKAPFYSPEILTTRPCHITASGSINYQWAGDGHSYAVLWIEGENFIDYDLCLIWETSITATPVSFDVGNCYWADVKIYHGGGWGIGSLSGEVSGNQAIFEWTEATGTVATATVIATPLPEYELSNCVMTANPTYLDANDDRSHEANIRAALYNGSGNPFEICGWYWCWFPSSMTFNIENPLNGMTLRGQQHDGTYVEGTSIEVSLGSAASNVFFVWDGGDIPNEIDTVSIRAEAYGVSAVQKIQLKKIVPHHFAVTPDVDIIYAGESVNVRAIAKDINDEEIALDGGKSVTFSDYSGKGSFIVGSDTIPNQATVSYDMAKSGSIKYYSKLDPSNLVDQYIMLWVALTEHPERNGYGYLEVITSCPVVHISRREVSPGDTAVVSIMARIKDGTELPYPPEQSFVIWMNTDEQYGRLRCISTGDEGSYVYGQQPFEFIAADNIDVDSTVVEIEASISTGGGGGGGAASIIDIGTKDTLRMPAGLMMKMQASKSKIGITDSIRAAVMERNTARSYEKLRKRLNVLKAKAKNKSQFDKILAKIETQYLGKNRVTKNTDVAQKSLAKSVQIAMNIEEGAVCEPPTADVTIKKKPCEDAPQCTGSPTMPTISIKELKRGDMNVDPCSQLPSKPGTIVGGGFAPLNTYEDYVVQPCFNSETGNWQFNIPEITVKVFLDLCENNILGNGQVFINSISEIMPGDYCAALRDFKDHANYPVGDPTLGPLPKRPLKYLIRPVFYNHEEIHKKNYQRILEELKPDFEKAILSYKAQCEEGKSIDDVIRNAKVFINTFIGDYLDHADSKRKQEAGLDPVDPTKQDTNERIKTQGSLEYLNYLGTFIDALKKSAPYCIQ